MNRAFPSSSRQRDAQSLPEPSFLAGPPLFWRLLVANLVVVLGGAVIGTTLTRQFVVRGAFTPLTHAAMVLAAIVLSAALTALILHLAFRPLRDLRRSVELSDGGLRPSRVPIRGSDPFGDPDILAVAVAINNLWDRHEQHVKLLEETNQRLELQRRELAQKTVQLEEAAKLVVAAQEEERRRIARELHDDTMQSMAALIMGLERGLEAMPEHIPHLRAAHHSTVRLRDLAVQMLNDLRYLALDLRPSVLDDYGLAAALRWLAEMQEERSGVVVSLEITGTRGTSQSEETDVDGMERLPSHVETALFRIAQEAISNVAKHAQAEHVRLRVEQRPDAVRIEVEDDGTGLPESIEGPPEHMGLFNMRERATLLGGMFSVGPGRGDKGTLVSAVLPLSVVEATLPPSPSGDRAAALMPPARPAERVAVASE